MKKYTIKDNLGNKKTIYARDLAHALKLNDDITYRGFKIYKVGGDWEVESRDGVQWNYDGSMTLSEIKKDLDKEIAKGYYDSKVKDDVVNDYREANHGQKFDKFWRLLNRLEDKNALQKLYKDVKNIQPSSDWEIKDKNNLLEQINTKIHIYFDSIKDEANLPTTIQALVNDEEAAIKAYEVAIKNLESKIDETQMQVLINIMKDERRHVENLYAILNGQVTEKNLEDSIKDVAPGVDEKKFNHLVSYFNAWGKPGRRELQDVIDYYRLNSATAYQLLIYWGYKDEFKKLHFYDSLSKAVK